MGFFSSRKAEDEFVPAEKSVVQVIRSRFYGKNKAKEREEPPSFRVQNTSAAQTLSEPSPSPVNTHSASLRITSFVANRKPSLRSLRNLNNEQKLKPKSQINIPPSSATVPSSPPRKPTDTVTMTLAQRLNELATANAEGLLDDDEYRLLRQNLFERFAGDAVAPSEASVVPVTLPRGHSPLRQSITSSNFVIQVPPSPSIRSSRRSISSGIFRRPSGHGHTPSHSKDHSDSSSIFSATSTTASNLLRHLSKKSSNSSVQTEASKQADTISISSRRTGTERSPIEVSPITSPRSAGSVRRFANPPSSFHTRGIIPFASESNKYPNGSSIQTTFDDSENLKTSEEIKQEIEAVEAEGRRLMDAFNGLELTTLAKRQRRYHHSSPNESSTWTLTLDTPRRKLDNDGLSIRSGLSAGTAPSITRSAYSAHPVPRSKSNISMSMSGASSTHGSLRRKGSISSVSSGRDAERLRKPLPPPPLPISPVSAPAAPIYSSFNSASLSSINLTKSTGHLPMRSVPEDLNIDDDAQTTSGRTDLDDSPGAVEDEMNEIRRRRDEVSLRYEARLEYLRAKLKGAQLHEKLLKK